MTPRNFIGDHEPDIVPVMSVLRAGIAEPNKESHDAASPRPVTSSCRRRQRAPWRQPPEQPPPEPHPGAPAAPADPAPAAAAAAFSSSAYPDGGTMVTKVTSSRDS